MTALKAIKSIPSRLVPGRFAKHGQDQAQPEKSEAHDQHVENSTEEFLLPLRPVAFPKVLPFHQQALDDQGWSTITYDTPNDKLHDASQALFEASTAFFDLPLSYKETFKTRIGSEEGWCRVEGEKEFITLRCLENTPKELKDATIAYWAEAGGLLDELLGRIAQSLGLPAEALTVYSKPCAKFPSEKTATMLRLFRYEGFEGQQSKIVAQPHRDLGLLSLVAGDTPGLEVWDRHVQQWFQIERNYDRPASSVLVGRQLELLSNGRYPTGAHLVRSYPDPAPLPDPESPTGHVKPARTYRYSIVFVLRAHSPIPINTDNLTTPITGNFLDPIKDITALELFKNIQAAHYNINTGIQEREEQRRRLAEKRNQSSPAVPIEPEVEN